MAGLVLTMAVMAGIALYLVGSLIRSAQREEGTTTLKQAWHNFGLSIAFCLLFLVSWVAHGAAEWQRYVNEQRAHEEPVEVVGYLQEFSAATLENWQSEFLQLFSFTVLAALLIHKGSAESRDSGDEMQAALSRIEKRLERIEGKAGAKR